METIEEYMEKSLFSPTLGFYERQNITEHFATPLTFNTGLCQFLARYLLSFSAPILEIGPGHGFLAEKIRNSTAWKQNQHNLFLCEKSQLARKNLEQKFYQDERINIQDQICENFSGTIFLQEVLDCFAAQWYRVDKDRLLIKGLNPQHQLLEQDIGPVRSHPYCRFLLEQGIELEGQHFLYSHHALIFFQKILSLTKSRCLIIDYGHLSSELMAANSLVKVPLRAYRKHKQIEHFWSKSGECDLTYDVDFSWYLHQAVQKNWNVDFYGSLTNFLINNLNFQEDLSLLKPFLDPRQFGEAFKVALISSAH